MATIFVIVADVIVQQSAQMLFTEDDHMIEKITPG
jgi:hypothetical protein